MKNILNKISNILEIIFGYGIMISLFFGGVSFLGYVIAIIIGGDVAVTICNVIYKGIFPYIVYATSIIVLLGLVKMYLCGEVALSTKQEKKKK